MLRSNQLLYGLRPLNQGHSPSLLQHHLLPRLAGTQMRRLFDFLCSPTSGARLQRPLMRWTAAALLQLLHQALQAAEHGEEASWAAQVPSTEAGRWATAFCEVSSGDPLFAAAISLLLCPAFGDSVQVWAIACWARAETLRESYCRARRAVVQQTVQHPVHDPGHGDVKIS